MNKEYYDLIMLVIANETNENLYNDFINEYWIKFIKYTRCYAPNIKIFLLFGEKPKNLKIHKSNMIISNTKEDLIPGILKKTIYAFQYCDSKYKYNVAWIDSLNANGRGVITSGEHALKDEIYDYFSKEKFNLLKYEPKAIANTPNLFPRGVLNRLTVKIFNEAWFRKVPKNGKNSFETISSFFHPLDGIENWNKIYGPKGFLQYQFVVPDSSAYLISKTLEKLRKIGAPSFLTVLKRFGNSNPGYLSFPMKGWTLAADVPISTTGLFQVLNDLDQEISESGGKLYLAKDSRQSEDIFKKTYPRYYDWIKIKSEMDPEGKFYSDLAHRIGI